MSIARGRINRARPIMLMRQITNPIMEEVRKGSLQTLAPWPVRLEPPFQPLRSHRDLEASEDAPPYEPDEALNPQDRIRLRIWVSPQEDAQWDRAEAFPRQLRGVFHRVTFEILGNTDGITLWLSCSRQDLQVIQTAFESTYPKCILRPAPEDPLSSARGQAWDDLVLFDLAAPSIYSKRFTEPEELSTTPLAAVLTALSMVPSPVTGLFQVVMQPAFHHWHRNIAALVDYEYLARSLQDGNPFMRGSQQLPGTDERMLAALLEQKAHNDRGFYAGAIRVAVIGGGEQGAIHLRTLDVFSGLIQHGGRPWHRLTEADYHFLSPALLHDMFCLGQTYRPGFLTNSRELTSLAHLPPAAILERHKGRLALLEPLRASVDLSEGSFIGNSIDAGVVRPICIPFVDRPLSVHLVGKSGRGKTETLKHIILGDVCQGYGVIVIDPHGDLVSDVLDLIPPEHASRAILAEWSDPQMIVSFNPLADVSPADRGTVSDNIVSCLKDVSMSGGFGHRAEHILKMLVLGLLHLPKASLLDVAYALDVRQGPGVALREAVLKVVDDPLLRKFWQSDLQTYTSSDKSPVRHKLGLLMDSPPVSRTFMQTQSALNIAKAMDEQKVVLVNLSGIGAEIQGTLGSLLVSLLQVETVARAGRSPGARKPVFVHIDEAHMFKAGALDTILVQCRKYNIGICFCHQYLRQYTQEQVDALATVGSTIIFTVGMNDARKLCQSLQERVNDSDIVSLPKHEAIARIDTEIVRIKTVREVPTGPSCRQEIIERSRSQYYRPVREVLREINHPNRLSDRAFEPLPSGVSGVNGKPPELEYEEL